MGLDDVTVSRVTRSGVPMIHLVAKRQAAGYSHTLWSDSVRPTSTQGQGIQAIVPRVEESSIRGEQIKWGRFTHIRSSDRSR